MVLSQLRVRIGLQMAGLATLGDVRGQVYPGGVICPLHGTRGFMCQVLLIDSPYHRSIIGIIASCTSKSLYRLCLRLRLRLHYQRPSTQCKSFSFRSCAREA